MKTREPNPHDLYILNLLTRLATPPRRISTAELATETGLHERALQRALARLEGAGLVCRPAPPRNERAYAMPGHKSGWVPATLAAALERAERGHAAARERWKDGGGGEFGC